MHSNDVHGQIDGYAYIAGLRNYFLDLGAEVILVDAGDFSQGSIYVSSSKGASAVEMMNAAGYDIVTLGNHEFDFGYPQLMDNLSKAQFQPICADVTLDETGASILPASAVFTTPSGLKVAFVGVETPETMTKVNPGLVNMITFAGFDKNPAGLALTTMLKARDKDFKTSPAVKWNFTKFLIGRDGEILARFEPMANMNKVKAAVEAALK